MVSWLPQFIVPVGFALIALPLVMPLARRQILYWSPMTWAADIDYAIQSMHRAWLHTVWVPLALAALLVLLWRRRDPTARFWEYASRPGVPGGLLLSAYYWLGHVLLDVFAGGSVLFWPLLNTNFYYSFHILLDTKTNQFVTEAAGGTSEGPPELAPLYPWFSTEHHALLLFLVIMGVAALGVWAWRRRGQRPPVVVEREAVAVELDPSGAVGDA